MGWVPELLQEQTNTKLPAASRGRSGTAQGKAAGGCKVLQDWGQAEVMASAPQSWAVLPAAPTAAWPRSPAALSAARPRHGKAFAAP